MTSSLDLSEVVFVDANLSCLSYCTQLDMEANTVHFIIPNRFCASYGSTPSSDAALKLDAQKSVRNIYAFLFFNPKRPATSQT